MDANFSRARSGVDAEGIHQLRVSARRLRSELRAMRQVLPDEPWDRLRDDLRWVGATLGGLRDLDVLGELFDSHLARATPLHDAVDVALTHRRAEHQRRVARLLDSSRYARVRRRLARLSQDPGLGALGRTSAAVVFTPVLWGATCAYLEAIGDPAGWRSDEDLHLVRIGSKKCRYNYEIGAQFLGPAAREVARHLEGIQDVLGQLHDRMVAMAFLDELGSSDRAGERGVRMAMGAEMRRLRPQWVPHFVDARRAMFAVFAPTSLGATLEGR